MAATAPLATSASRAGTPATTTGSWAGRFVALLTPIFAVGAAWIAAFAARHIPGVVLDQGEITNFMLAATTAATASALKWLHGWQKHEARQNDQP